MNLKKMTPEMVEEVQGKLSQLNGKEVTNVFANPNFPLLNSITSGSVENQPFPTWYTQIHDALECAVVEYDKDDIENENFLDVKFALLPDGLKVYLIKPGVKLPFITLELNVDVIDLEAGTFIFNRPIVQQFQISRDELNAEPVMV